MQNCASNCASVVGGGAYVCATGNGAVAIGGFCQAAIGTRSTVLGGYQSKACGDHSTVGGCQNQAFGENSVVIGGHSSTVRANHTNSAVFGTNIASVSSDMLHATSLFLSAACLPTSDPNIPGVVWNDSGTLKISTE